MDDKEKQIAELENKLKSLHEKYESLKRIRDDLTREYIKDFPEVYPQNVQRLYADSFKSAIDRVGAMMDTARNKLDAIDV